VRDVPHHHGVRHAELVLRQDRVEHFFLQLPAIHRLALRFELLAGFRAHRLQRLELCAEGLRELVVELGEHLLLHLDELHVGGAGLPA
jgi:hypothetical protein